MKTQKKRAGRPTTSGVEGQKSTLSIRASADLKGRLDTAAKRSGRSLSQEAEIRLENSFRDENYALNAFDVTFGKANVGMLLLIGQMMNAANQVSFLCGNGSNNWLDDAVAFQHFVRITNEIFAALRPEGDPNFEAHPELSDNLVRGAASSWLPVEASDRNEPIPARLDGYTSRISTRFNRVRGAQSLDDNDGEPK